MIAKALRNKILWSTAVQYGGRLIQVAIGIVVTKLITNSIGTDDFGLVGKVTEFALFFATISNLGIFGNVVRKMADAPKDGQLFTNALFVRLSTGALFLGTGLAYNLLFIEEPVFKLAASFFFLSLFLDYVVSICTGMLQANYMMGRAVFVVTLSKLLEFGFIYWAIQNNSLTVSTVFIAVVLTSTFSMLASLALVRHQMKFIWKLDLTLLKEFLFSSIPFGIINISNNLYFRFLPSFFAAKILTNTIFAQYNLSTSMMNVGAMLSTFLMFSTLPALKHSLSEGHPRRVKELFKKTTKGLIALAIAMVIGGSLLGPWALTFVSSAEFYQSEYWFIFPLLMLLGASSLLYDLVLVTLFALEEEIWFLKQELITVTAGTILFLLAMLPSSPLHQMPLILLAAIAAEAFMVIRGFQRIHIKLN